MKLFKLLKDHKLLTDILNVALGLAVIVFLILFFLNPTSPMLLRIVVFLGGALNIFNGMKMIRQQQGKKNTGMSMILIGIIVIFVGYFLSNNIS